MFVVMCAVLWLPVSSSACHFHIRTCCLLIHVMKKNSHSKLLRIFLQPRLQCFSASSRPSSGFISSKDSALAWVKDHALLVPAQAAHGPLTIIAVPLTISPSVVVFTFQWVLRTKQGASHQMRRSAQTFVGYCWAFRMLYTLSFSVVYSLRISSHLWSFIYKNVGN